MLPVFLLVAGVGAVVYSLDKIVNKGKTTVDLKEKTVTPVPVIEPEKTLDDVVRPKKKKDGLAKLNEPDGTETTEEKE